VYSSFPKLSFAAFVLGFLTNVCSSFLKLSFDSFVLGFLTNVCSSFLKLSFRSSLITFHLFTFVFNRFRWLFFAYSVVFRHWFSRMFFFIRLSLTLMHESTQNSSLILGTEHAISQFSLMSLKCTTEPVITCWNLSTALLALKKGCSIINKLGLINLNMKCDFI
jgi:hypothetical protein